MTVLYSDGNRLHAGLLGYQARRFISDINALGTCNFLRHFFFGYILTCVVLMWLIFLLFFIVSDVYFIFLFTSDIILA